MMTVSDTKHHNDRGLVRLVSDTVSAVWRRAFLEERPSTLLGVFRLAAAVTVGCHMIPWFVPIEDTYLATAFKEYNPSFFPIWTLALVSHSPNWLVFGFVGLFFLSWGSFLIGFRAQLSCIVMTPCCYYFYALNSLHIGTLSFDILLVTLFLLCVTNYHGDWLSLDSVLRGDSTAYKKPRPFFLQRLLQLQLATTFWQTALGKITASGNWLTDYPYYYLMHYPPEGVVRHFPFRAWLAQHQTSCYWLQVSLLVFEFSLPLLLFVRRTRLIGLVLGFGFHVILLVTLHVPTIFFFLFPPQMLLFLDPEPVVGWIEAKRSARAAQGQAILLYDGHCGFCQESVRRWTVLDLFGFVRPVDFHSAPDLAQYHRDLTPEHCQRRMQLVEPDGRLSDGYFAFRRMSRKSPMLWPVLPLLYLPGAGWIGQRAYDWIAKRRFLFHPGRACGTNQCGLPGTAAGSGASSNS